MPRVSQAHLDARRTQILDAAQRVFARRGFAGTSMQDVFAESGLSAGAVYRYFRSREEIVEAIAERALRPVHGVLDEALAADPPEPLDEVLGRVAGVVAANAGPEGVARLTLQLWGQALYSERIGDLARREYGELRRQVTQLVRRAQATGRLDRQADAEHLGAALFAVLPGFVVQRLLLGGVEPEAFQDGLRALLSPAQRAASDPGAGVRERA